ncbi:hypothetical protein DFH08DRAFT_1074775 [Mycena albidolilacea]|uniref:Uncharacterized protein n=1 Tax=Mycena albidolilacea TaxID=1033008 RepID=A0AAD7AHQ7_9AGAR|nr:hypothetical protein DFH08DRAFT_1074775 [Mycena albidolilacea]
MAREAAQSRLSEAPSCAAFQIQITDRCCETIIHAPIAIAPSLPAPIVDMDLDLDLSLDLNLNLKLGSQVEMDLDPAEHDLGDGAEVEHEEELPLLKVPRTFNAELQMTMDAVAERLNGLVRARAVSSPAPPSLPLDYRRSTKRTVSRYVAADESFGGVGLGVGGAKKDWERKGKHSTLPALKPKRSTISLLASPITFATATNHHAATEATMTTSRLTSPVVGEFKGWFSNLFKKTRREVGLLLEKLGIVIEESGFSAFPEGTKVEDDLMASLALRCKVKEGSTEDAQMVLKPVRFRVEFSAAPSRVLTYPPPPSHKHHSAPLSPNSNTNNLPSAALGALLAALLDPPLKTRASVLVNRTASSSAAFPPGCQSAIVLMHEKGSASTFKNVWKRRTVRALGIRL